MVWSVVRRFDQPQTYKHFVKSCHVIDGGGDVGTLRRSASCPACRRRPAGSASRSSTTSATCSASGWSAGSTASPTTAPSQPSTRRPRGARWWWSRTWWTCRRGTPGTTPASSSTPSSGATSSPWRAQPRTWPSARGRPSNFPPNPTPWLPIFQASAAATPLACPPEADNDVPEQLLSPSTSGNFEEREKNRETRSYLFFFFSRLCFGPPEPLRIKCLCTSVYTQTLQESKTDVSLVFHRASAAAFTDVRTLRGVRRRGSTDRGERRWAPRLVGRSAWQP
ncbi:Polyketide cyclase / dehydrase and lipid transport [Musa troglodytarum]|nr:Polyketide cyclase / dehydrase and lipid transport [Musa troglodytarum]